MSVEVIRFCILGLSLNLPVIILLLGDPRRPGEAYPPALRSISMNRTGRPRPHPTAVDNRAAATEQARSAADPGPGQTEAA